MQKQKSHHKHIYMDWDSLPCGRVFGGPQSLDGYETLHGPKSHIHTIIFFYQSFTWGYSNFQRHHMQFKNHLKIHFSQVIIKFSSIHSSPSRVTYIYYTHSIYLFFQDRNFEYYNKLCISIYVCIGIHIPTI